MDIVTHLSFAGTLNALDRDRVLGRAVGAAMLLGSIVPDVDAVVAFASGVDVYLANHEAGTHTLLASGPLALTASAPIYIAGLIPWNGPRGQIRARLHGASRFSHVVLAAWCGVLSHLAWDLLSGSTMQLFSPLASTRMAWPLVPMADPFIVLVLLMGLVVGRMRVAARRAVAVGALVLVAGILGARTLSQTRAEMKFAERARDTPAPGKAWRADPVWGSFSDWLFHARLDSHLGTWAVSAFDTAPPKLVFSPPAAADTAAVRASQAVPVVQRFLGFADFPFPAIEQEAGERRILWSDLKFCNALRCDLRFGVAFGDQLAPQYEIIWIGGLRVAREYSKP